MSTNKWWIFAVAGLLAGCGPDAKQQGPMTTEWTALVDKQQPLPEYPRPAMVREFWTNLNGPWDYAIVPAGGQAPQQWEGTITVPFPVESPLSGVQRTLGKDSALWYRRSFTLDAAARGKKILLHFGASDWKTEVLLNGQSVGAHEGGYTAFSFDITNYLKEGSQELVVRVTDPTDDGPQARGKQVRKPGGIYYTPATGIWQTVWYEALPESYINNYVVNTDFDKSTVSIDAVLANAQPGDQLRLKVFAGDQLIKEVTADTKQAFRFQLPDARHWHPDTPFLYTFGMSLHRQGATLDSIAGYFGIRKVEVKKDAAGVQRIFLNNEPLFQYGFLDQGYWPDGIYTAPTEAALLSDITRMKEMGMNMVRKHVKVEPQRWYYHCDRLGLLVWQDMPSGYGEIVPVKDHDYSVKGDSLGLMYKDVDRTPEEERIFRDEWKAIVQGLYNHPSIIVWVPFNESWGQFKTNELLAWTKALDPTRLTDGPSGWIDRGEGDLRDYHLYNDRLDLDLPLEAKRALVVGEFGGLGYAVEGHTFNKDSWSYQGFKNSQDLEAAYAQLINRILALKQAGYSAAVYTQLTDVETEINGLITYDRKLVKIPLATLKKLHAPLYK
ncbi:MAG: glycoside hydrolase family 2 TIM barrel-domain containing protein [Candidatus Pseudobacter hemicellulosilyticus]|uniref:Glycoside hydrolase family 2 TIM barrel-domain containing protein n=1 Tax=Candidatus Pseudobacter hemicellulosilyticus TaxID=3121375 RepID=A0AAJ6BJV8_9BACT|nr:MAG: glycoside hydrolase family 2 TIM barrel-domain containing protein [Pseudobacter sp.]